MLSRDPTKHEERASDTTGIQKIEEIVRGLDDATGKPTPIFEGERPVYTADVKPLFNVDGQSVEDHVDR